MTWDSAFTVTNGISTIGVAVFAWLQWSLTKRADLARRAERAEDLARQREVAYAAVQAEWFRLWTVASNWGRRDLVQLVEADQFDPSDFAPREWASITTNLGYLGMASAKIGSYGLAVAHDATRAANDFLGDCEAFFEHWPTPPAERAAFHDQYMSGLREQEHRLKALVLEAANILQDAIEHSPDAHLPRIIRFNENLHSDHVRRIAAAVQASGKAAVGTSPESWKVGVRE